jgi:hypothetical protein
MLAKTWALLLAAITLACWAVWVGLGYASWWQWYTGAFPAAVVMGLIGFVIGFILDYPDYPQKKQPPVNTALASKTVANHPEDATTNDNPVTS